MSTGFSAEFRCRAFALTIVLLLSSLVCAQIKPQITQAIDPAKRSVLGKSVHPLANSMNDRGTAGANLPMKDMLLMLRPAGTQLKALKQYVDDLHNANSPKFHQWLTPEQYASQFGAADEDVNKVTEWLVTNGFTVEQVARGKNWIRFSGKSSQVEQAFQTQIHEYVADGGTRYANATPLSIPAAMAPAVAGVVSVNNFISSPQHVNAGMIARNTNGKLVRMDSVTGTPQFTNPGDQEQAYFAPADFAKIYNSQSLLSSGTDGTGVSIAIVGRSDISLSDVEAFRTVFGLPQNDPNVIYASTDPGVVPGDDMEAILDVEWSGAVAPNAKINYVIGATTTTTDGVNVAASYVVDNAVSPIVSVSFGLCEANMSDAMIDFYHLLWQQAAAQGMTVFVSSGDAGAAGCNTPSSAYSTTGFGVNGLASTPYNVAVGGTEFNEPDLNSYWNLQNGPGGSSAKGYIPEAVWNESCSGSLVPSFTNCYFPPYYLYTMAGGGGVSSCAIRTFDDTGVEYCAAGYPKPSWQIGSGVPDDGVRDVPDVSLNAASVHDPYMICYNGSCQWQTDPDGSTYLMSSTIVGGTSAATPAMAGVMALLEQQHGQFQGLANYQLYKLSAAQTDLGACDSSQRTDPAKSSSCIFNDVTVGSNAVPCRSGGPDCSTTALPASTSGAAVPNIVLPATIRLLNGYSATSGYDLATGLGSVDVKNLINSWGINTTLPSTTQLTVSQTSFQHGTPITMTALVAPTSGTGTPSGEVLFQAGTGRVQSGTLTDGTVTGTTINLPGGTYSLTAHYSGDATYGVSTSNAVSVTVTPEDSTLTGTTFAYSPFYVQGKRPLRELTSARLGEPFFIQVQVAGVSGATKATGSITLSTATKVIGTYPLNEDGLIYVQCGPSTECDLGVGDYEFTAAYSGDASYNASTTAIPFRVSQGLLYWSVLVNTQTPPVGGQVIATAYFETQSNIMPTGTATFSRSDTAEILGSATIDSAGTASIAFAAPEGTYSVQAAYDGDTNYIAASQHISQQIITQTAGGTRATTASLSTSITTVPMGSRTQFNVAIVPNDPSNATPIGTVTLYSKAAQISAPVTLMGGKATGFVEWYSVGVQDVYAIYSGDKNFQPSNSAKISVTVTPATPTLALSTPAAYVLTGAQASVSAVLNSPLANTNVLAPTGAIQFYDSIGGAAAQPIGTPQAINVGNNNILIATLSPQLAAGTHSITAQYSGDASWKGVSSSAVQIVVTTPDFTVAATPNPLTVVAGQTASISISTAGILGYTGPVALSCGGTLPAGVTCNTSAIASGATGTLTLTTTAPGTLTQTAHSGRGVWGLAGTLSLALLGLFCLPRRRKMQGVIVALIAVSITGAMVGCGGSSPKPTTILLTSSNTKAASGTGVTFQATVGSDRKLSGTVTFYDGATAIGSPVSPVDGVASLTTSTLGVGTHAITAKYSGDKSNNSSESSNVLEQTMTGAFTLVVNATSGTLSHTISIPTTLQ